MKITIHCNEERLIMLIWITFNLINSGNEFKYQADYFLVTYYQSFYQRLRCFESIVRVDNALTIFVYLLCELE